MNNVQTSLVKVMMQRFEQGSGQGGFLQAITAAWEFVRGEGVKAIEEVLKCIEQGRARGCCPKCGVEGVRQHRSEPKRYRTTFGITGAVGRSEYRCAGCGENFYPLDEELGVVKDGQIAVDLTEAVVFHCVKVSYDEAVDSVRHDYGQAISAKEAQLLAARVSERVEPEDVRVEEPVRRSDRAYVSQDGVMVRSREAGRQWQTINAGITFSEMAEISSGRRAILDKEYLASPESGEAFEAVLYEACKRRGVLAAEEIVYLGDGHETVKAFYERRLKPLECMGKKVRPILDPYHLAEKLTERSREIISSRDERRAFHDRMWELLWLGDVDKAIVHLLAQSTTVGSKAAQAQQKFLAYLNRNKSWIPNYEALREQGYIISSGAMEKANDTLVARRMKRKGMRWSRDGAGVLTTLRVLRANGRWDSFWERRRAAS